MRTFINGAGADVTTTVVAYLKSKIDKLILADLYLIGELEDTNAYFLTDWPTALSWPFWGNFQPTTIKRGTVTSQVGLEVSTLEIDWSPPLGIFTNNIAATSPYQLAQIGFFDNKKVRMWRAVMPTPGDANTYGACEFFGGWIADSTVDRGIIKFNVESFLNVVNQKLPSNLLEGTSALASFLAGAPVIVDGETNVPTFTVVSGSDATIILATCIQPSAGKIYGDRKLALGYLVFISGSLKGAYSIVAVNSNFNAGGGVHYNQIQVYTPFPWDPAPGDTFYVATQPPVTSTDPAANQYLYKGFPFLPDPEQNL